MKNVKTASIQSNIKVNPEAWNEVSESILTPELLSLLNQLHHELNEERQHLLDKRQKRQQTYRGPFVMAPIS